MKTLKKYAVIFGMGILAIPGIMFLTKVVRETKCSGGDNCKDTSMFEKAGKGIDDKLKESTAALDKATAQVMSVFDHLKDKKA